MSAPAPSIAVIACGNPIRSDDGVGLAVLRLLAARRASDPRVRLLDAGTDGVAALYAAQSCRTLILVDACRTGSEPGAIFEVPAVSLPTRSPPPPGSHAFRWDDAIQAARLILGDAFPADASVHLVEAFCLDYGLELSPVVAEAAARVADRIEVLLSERLAVLAMAE